jgi:hypothetical protein
MTNRNMRRSVNNFRILHVLTGADNTKILKDIEEIYYAYGLHIGKLHIGIGRANY